MIDFTDYLTREVVDLMRYSLVTHDTTWGECSNGCGGVGRGCGPCWNCLRAELVKRVGEERAGEVCKGLTDERDRRREAQCR